MSFFGIRCVISFLYVAFAIQSCSNFFIDSHFSLSIQNAENKLALIQFVQEKLLKEVDDLNRWYDEMELFNYIECLPLKLLSEKM